MPTINGILPFEHDKYNIQEFTRKTSILVFYEHLKFHA